MTEKQKYREATPCGTLTVGKEVYLLLSPDPIRKHWEGSFYGLRYLATPANGMYNVEHKTNVYRCARYVIVFGDHYIDTMNSAPILVKDIGKGDLLGEVHNNE